MEPSPPLIDWLYREQVEQAKAMAPEQKLLAGLRLFDQARRIMLDGIAAEFPDLDPHQHLEILRARLALLRRREASA